MLANHADCSTEISQKYKNVLYSPDPPFLFGGGSQFETIELYDYRLNVDACLEQC